MGVASLLWSSFNDGELSPLVEGRIDMPQYMKGGKIMLNFIPTVQGPAVRRGGTRYIANARFSGGVDSAPSLLIRFSRSQTESFILEFFNRTLRFYFNGGLVVDGSGIPYEITTPYQQADLYNDDGTPGIVVAESADVLYLASPNHPPQTLSFFGPTNWVLAPLVNADGPWMDGNPTMTNQIYATGGLTVGSTVTLTSNTGGTFVPGHVGSLFRLHQQDLTTIKPWAPGEQTPNIAVGVQRRAGFLTFQCTNANAGIPPAGGTSLLFVQCGGTVPVQTFGKSWDGDQTTTITPIGASTYYSTGVQWQYEDCGYGVVQITGYTDGTHVTGTVLRQLPASVMSVGGASWNWEMGAWNNANGFPSCVTFFLQRLTFAAGQRVWMSVAGDFANFADMDFGSVHDDSAVTLQCLSDQVNTIVYLSPAQTLMVGTTGGEFIIGQQSISDPFGPSNVSVSIQSLYGGRAVVPIRVQQFTLFVTKNGRSLRESSFAFTAGPAGSYVSNDLAVLSEHITAGGIIGMAWAKNPYTTIFMVLGNGNLISFTYNPEQEVKAWARHDTGENRRVINVAVVPNSTGEWDDVYLQIANDSDGDMVYSIERIEQPYANLPGDSQQDAFYVDAGSTLNNTIAQTLIIQGDATVAGNVVQVISPGSFASTDVNRLIHYDYTVGVVGDDGLTFQQYAKGILLITQYIDPATVNAVVNYPFPAGVATFSDPIPANGWRMTVTQILGIPGPITTQTVSILADGACQPDTTIPLSGIITLNPPASIAQVGIRSPAVFQTMKPEVGDRTGISIGKIRKVIKSTLRLLNALGPKLGRNEGSLVEIELRSPTIPNDDPPPIFTGDTPRDTFNGDWDRDGRVMVVADQPLPLTLCAIGMTVDLEEDG